MVKFNFLAKDLVLRMMNPNSRNRITPSKAARHVFLSLKSNEAQELNQITDVQGRPSLCVQSTTLFSLEEFDQSPNFAVEISTPFLGRRPTHFSKIQTETTEDSSSNKSSPKKSNNINQLFLMSKDHTNLRGKVFAKSQFDRLERSESLFLLQGLGKGRVPPEKKEEFTLIESKESTIPFSYDSKDSDCLTPEQYYLHSS
jgi:hypothetical protein